ncbi:hypothetical protein [Nocardioides daejeonensis]|uniref:hypothetical protein n=1 Tax=Nocardioides daejeonensis TaxID=1046556 RepID=UPI000D74C60F|nr:hypothetical protein [Nocardioides daejeonensis]
MFVRGTTRRGAKLAAVAAGALVVTVLPGLSTANAAVTGPANGAVVSGKVQINEGRGGTTNCLLNGGSPKSRMQVTRVADGASVHTDNRNGSGGWSSEWNTVGQPLGAYRIRTWATDYEKSGFLGTSCNAKSEALLSDLTVTVQNKADVTLSLPSHVVTGETLPVNVQTNVKATNISGTAAPERRVSVTVPGVGTEEVTTDAQGKGQVEFDLPDLPQGTLGVEASVADDGTYLGLSGTGQTTLDRRTTGTLYSGDTRAQPDTRPRLAGTLVDLTPESDRFGTPLGGHPLRLKLAGDEATVETTASGRAVRSVPVTGQSRVLTASATFDGDQVWSPSKDEIDFLVGDATAPQAPVEHSTVGGTTRGLGSLLSGLLSPVVNLLGLPGLPPLTLNGLLNSLLGPNVTLTLGALGDANLLHLASALQLQELLDDLLGTVTQGVSRLGDPVDKVIDKVIDKVTANSPLAELADTARYEWRSVYVAPDGRQVAKEFGAIMDVPEPLDVTGDGVPDVMASLVITQKLMPRLKIARLKGAPTDLPLSLQAVLTLPGDQTRYRFGYDTRTTQAPKAFQADIALSSAGATLQVASTSDQALSVTGAVSPRAANQAVTPPSSGTATDDDGSTAGVPALAPKEQRFGVSFDPAPASASLALAMPNGQVSAQNVAATLHTDRPTTVGINLADDSGGDQVFLANARISKVDGDLALSLNGGTEGAMGADLRADGGLDEIEVTATDLDKGRTASDIRLRMTDVPDTISFGLGADGAGSMTSSGAIGDFQAGYSTGGKLVTLDEDAYLRLLTRGEHTSVALRLPGFEGMALDMADNVGLGLTMAPTPLHALMTQEGLELDATIQDAPHQLTLGLSTDGNVKIKGSDPIDHVSIDAHDDNGIMMGATDLSLALTDIPSELSVEVTDAGAVFDTGNQAIGLLELSAGSGELPVIADGSDGLTLEQGGPGGLALAARISGLRKVAANLTGAPEVLLDTTAGKVFDVSLKEYDDAGALTNDVKATIDHLVPNLRLGLVDDGTGAVQLHYTADEPTNSLNISMGDLKGSIANPLPTRLDICMAGDEACLPEVGIEAPALGTISFSADDYTTLNLADPARGINVKDLRLQRLDLTGDLNTDDGGPVYLNTTDFDGDCGNAGCERPIQGGLIGASLSGAELNFTPGNGFSAVDARTDLVPTKILGQTTGVKGVGGTGIVRCVSATALKVTVQVIGIPITLDLKDAICNVPNRTPRG